MRVEWAIACRYAEVNDNLFTIIGAGIDNMYVPTLPMPVQVAVAARLVGTPEELTARTHTVRCVAYGPDDVEELARAEGQMELRDLQVRNPADWLASLHVPMGIVFPVSAEGAYRLEVGVDDSDAYLLPLHIHSGPPPGAAPPAADG